MIKHYVKTLETPAPAKSFGLGDAVAVVAQPVAKVIDAVAGTHVATCIPCKNRRKSWNDAIPNLNPFKK